MLLSAEQLSINFGSRQLLQEVNFYLNEGDKTGVIGINGTGKSTFLKVLAGRLEPDGGTVSRNPNVQVSLLEQNPPMDDDLSILAQVFAQAPEEFRSLNEYEARSMLTRLGFTDLSRSVGSLSGGERRRVALVSALIHPADVLILDEPTNHLDSQMVSWLEQWLRRFTGGLVMVTHDRYFLERVCNHITELSRARLYHYEANYSRYLELRAQREEMEEASERKRQSILRRELEWIRRGCRARTTKSKDRIERYEALRDRPAPEQEQSLQMTAASSRLGRKIIELEQVSKSYGDRQILAGFSYRLLRGDRIGIVGPNGAGKSTLLRLLAGELQPDGGSIDRGSTVKIGHFSQEGRQLRPEQRVFDFIHEIASELRCGRETVSAKQMMERFLFPTELQSQPIGRLSGGERRRLYLLSVLMSAPNVLLLDEPTNDLDVMTLSILEDYLQSFEGPVVIVSHDRFFLDKLAEQIFEVQPGGRVAVYSGNWSDYAAKRQELSQPQPQREEKPRPQRVREKKLKFSYREERDFATIDGDIADLEQLIADNQAAQLACGSDYQQLSRLQQELSGLEQTLEEKTQRWYYLHELKERIDAQNA